MSCSWVYVLKDYNDYYYVGTTNRLITRFKEHATGRGAKATKKFFYNELVGLYKVGDQDQEELEQRKRENFEDIITLQLMKLQTNPKKVRGGRWTTHGIEGENGETNWNFSTDLIKRLRSQEMPVTCYCGLPALKTQYNYVCSIRYNMWVEDRLNEKISINQGCDFKKFLTFDKAKEPNYCSVCSIPCGAYSTCYEHKIKKTNNEDLESFGLCIKNNLH